jgi:hypothetical protein
MPKMPNVENRKNTEDSRQNKQESFQRSAGSSQPNTKYQRQIATTKWPSLSFFVLSPFRLPRGMPLFLVFHRDVLAMNSCFCFLALVLSSL